MADGDAIIIGKVNDGTQTTQLVVSSQNTGFFVSSRAMGLEARATGGGGARGVQGMIFLASGAGVYGIQGADVPFRGGFPEGGVVGVSNMEQGATSPGVHGQSTVAEGVLGEAVAGEQDFPTHGTHGVRGRTANNQAAGVRAEHTGDGPGLHATSGSGDAILARGAVNGVTAISDHESGAGVWAENQGTGEGLRAVSAKGAAIVAEGAVGIAVTAHGGSGVVANTSGWFSNIPAIGGWNGGRGPGVLGEARSTEGAIEGRNGGGGPGVLGIGLYGNGVIGFGSTAVAGVGVTGRTGPNSPATGVYGSVDLPTEGSVGVAGEMFLEWSGVPVNGVSGRTNSAPGSGVYGENFGGGYGVAGRSNEPNGTGVFGEALGTGGVALLGQAAGDGTALRVQGKASFQRSGSVKVSAGSGSATVTNIELSASSLIFLTMQGDSPGVRVKAAVPDVANKRFDVLLEGAGTADTTVAWFIID